MDHFCKHSSGKHHGKGRTRAGGGGREISSFPRQNAALLCVSRNEHVERIRGCSGFKIYLGFDPVTLDSLSSTWQTEIGEFSRDVEGWPIYGSARGM